jgi:hypothetical protein
MPTAANDLVLALRDGAVLALLICTYVMVVFRINPRLFLRQYPKTVRDAVSPNTPPERALIFALGTGLFLLLGAGIYLSQRLAFSDNPTLTFKTLWLRGFLVATVFNLADWLLLDELWLGQIRPRWAVMPGAEHVAHGFERARHLRGFVLGFVPSAVFAASGAWAVLRGY